MTSCLRGESCAQRREDHHGGTEARRHGGTEARRRRRNSQEAEELVLPNSEANVNPHGDCRGRRSDASPPPVFYMFYFLFSVPPCLRGDLPSSSLLRAGSAPPYPESSSSHTGSRPGVHGAPVHIGEPAQIGIEDLMKTDFGDPPAVAEGQLPVFWACGVTPQIAVEQARPPICITHRPGSMLITDVKNSALASF